MHDDDLRTFYRTYYDGYDMPSYDDANPSLKIRLRLAIEALDKQRDERYQAETKLARRFTRLPLRERLRLINEYGTDVREPAAS